MNGSVFAVVASEIVASLLSQARSQGGCVGCERTPPEENQVRFCILRWPFLAVLAKVREKYYFCDHALACHRTVLRA